MYCTGTGSYSIDVHCPIQINNYQTKQKQIQSGGMEEKEQRMDTG